jgi:hypothetical protein
MLIAHMALKQDQENELEEARFERDMFLANPAMYQEYLNSKKEKELYGDNSEPVTNLSEEEHKEIERIIKEMNEKIPKEQRAADSAFIEQVSKINPFANINVNEMSED